MSKAEDIIERLKQSFNNPTKKDERIKVVLICIVISTTFWFFNALNKNDYTTRINYPIDLQFDENEYIATSDIPSRVPIDVTGGGWDLMARYFGLKMETLDFNLENPQAGFLLSNSFRSLISQELEPIQINYFISDSIKFSIDRLRTKEVLLEYDEDAVIMADDYMRTSPIELTPRTMVIEGPQTSLESFPNTLVITELLEDVDEDFSAEVDLPDLPELVVSRINSIEVSFDVVKLFNIDIDLPIQLRNFPDSSWSIKPARAEVFYKVSVNEFDVTDTSQISLYVDFDKMLQDSTMNIEVESMNENFRDIQISEGVVKAGKND